MSNTLENVTVNVSTVSADLVNDLAQAVLTQAVANETNSMAMCKLADVLKPGEVCGIKIVSDVAPDSIETVED